MYEDILVPTDGSETADAAVDHAIAIAERFEATVHGLAVLEQGPYSNPKRDRIRADLEAEAESALETITKRAETVAVPVETAIEPGVPHVRVLEAIDERGIDLVVMGTHGRTGLDRLLIGSIAERVVRTSPVPVVTVRLER